MDAMTDCVHHWEVASPDGPESAARCKLCGERAVFWNSTGESRMQSWVDITRARRKRLGK